MTDNTINNLRDALAYSPGNIPLRLLLAEALLKMDRLDEAETEYSMVLSAGDDHRARVGLAQVFYKKGNYSACNVILEDLMDTESRNIDVLVLHAKALLKEGSVGKAIEIYKKVLVLVPNYTDDELDNDLRMTGTSQLPHNGGEEDDERFLQRPTINFNDVGGMEAVKREIELKILKPMLHPELYKAYGKKIGGGILLYGPPGCGKTFIAKATAGQVNARFITVGLNEILDMWIGNSEKNLHEVFELARQHTPCVLFIDEIDALGASRSDMKQSAGRHLINQFLQELDGISNDNEGVLVIGATNTPWNLDPAFRRPGRFDRIIFVPPPDDNARQSILRIKLAGKPIEAIDYKQLSGKLDNYSGADINALIDIAIEMKLEESFSQGEIKPIQTKDLLAAAKKHKASTQEWFTTAKNFALFANDGGLYDEILTFLKIKK
ncbi:ATP-binding protein [Hufsiella ginkgonis]|uniref:AAA family ATPase n=1 Tax=Hufsiella ginkgonis TaxID=2695274 RepID=A0A7K1Y0I4_9SPHI|nr:ATP-binding protein [Hufsiella ginkgonis]MXV16784.1 AAA family ATPase [Hufsiella ginkgonis]